MVGSYPTPATITYFWNFGSLAALFLAIQIITGIFLAMYYVPHIDLAFASVEHVMRDVNYGWLLRYLHANGAAMFFIVVYLHMFRGLYYGSYDYPRQEPWIVGVTIFFLMIATAFFGYVLPWGQMSFWAATVITNLFGAIPVAGRDIVQILWGGFSVDNATLNRFYSFHFLLPFLIAGLSGLHVTLLHVDRANTPHGVPSALDTVFFHPYFTFKDLYGVVLAIVFYSVFVFFFPNLMGHSDNYIPANPMVTPSSIVPEWYFLPFYAILRAIPDKLGGVVAMAMAILILYVLPAFALSDLRSHWFRPLSKIFFWAFAVNAVILAWLGGNHPESPYVEISRGGTLYYFAYISIVNPIAGVFENISNVSD